ncbi:Pimeloyl-ACP methyl ester carboxylesterase [Streptomyces sp. DvalAA-14]|uniref:alpha/beta hydrolase n=1 Tax=unclassified Streptomyces TaxID=2593676 RepID=UPI00081B1658|nr:MULTISPECIES: alpha/beta hydrolase [unclassified Streptomyces]MYS20083.1 alpha/beta fold hydrolase [Streptomyces sp. SID4948]SCD60539.1 Pimeloyl-ACP methyl ester carboxylesterase [Streptomyces sp. DvalAA-14]
MKSIKPAKSAKSAKSAQAATSAKSAKSATKKWALSAAAAAGAAALLSGVLVTTASAHDSAPGSAPAVARQQAKPTVVLVHGAFEDTSGWSGVTSRLQRAGYPVVVPAVPLRGVASDATYLENLLKTIPGPLVLAGHSYGGALIGEVAAHNSNVKALVYAAAFIPQAGETIGALNAQFPGSLLGPDTSYTVDNGNGSDLYIKASSFRDVFAADRPAAQAAVTAAGQRPIDASAFTETITGAAPADIPKYAIVADQDHAIAPAAEQFEATRAGATVYHVRSSHDVAVSHPGTVTSVIERAATQLR